ncbi:extracellular solute-binding protein [Halorubrum sp. AD140]|uniref:extracellular solute-binding protein n=1 Tax=Halorubrum sp. AD140 TaxID=3050073 RepID=UPI002ACCA1D6|nr:extracellular solute-binding protein [Halorubrum sp. AD140]MDZ5811817.1 extracellular solute-binding protein [Halorubrum sp. AD140]
MTDHVTNGSTYTRRRVLGGAATAGGIALAGCSDGGDGSEGAVEAEGSAELELTGWAADDTEADLVRGLAENFDENHDEISVTYEPVQSEYEQTMRSRLGGGEAPDVFYLDASYFSSFADEDVLLDLDPLTEVDEYDVGDIFDPLLEAFRFDGTLYGIPKDFSTLSLYYNESILEEAGVDEVPESWGGLQDALTAIDDTGSVDAPMVEFANARMFWSLLHQNGGQVLSDDGSELLLDSQECIEALEFMIELRDDEVLAVPSEIGVDWHGQAIGTEATAMAVIGPWALPALEGDFEEVESDIGVAHIPYPSSGERATAAYTVSYSCAADTDAPGASRELVTELTDDEGMAEWARQGLALSARESHADLDYYADHERRRTHLEAGEWSHPVAFGPESNAILNRVNPLLEGAMLDEQEPAEALERATQQVNDEVL